MLMWQHDWFNLKLFLLIQDLSQLSKFKLFGGLNAFSILLPYFKIVCLCCRILSFSLLGNFWLMAKHSKAKMFLKKNQKSKDYLNALIPGNKIFYVNFCILT